MCGEPGEGARGAGREEEEEEVRRATAASGRRRRRKRRGVEPAGRAAGLKRRRTLEMEGAQQRGPREGGQGEGAQGGPRTPESPRAAGRGLLEAALGSSGPGGGGWTPRGGPGKERAAPGRSWRPRHPRSRLPSPLLPPPALTSHLLPSLFLPPSVPRGKACSSPSPGARRRGPSRAAFPPRPGSGRRRGLPTRGRPGGGEAPTLHGTRA